MGFCSRQARFLIYRRKYSKSRSNMAQYVSLINSVMKSEYIIAKKTFDNFDQTPARWGSFFALEKTEYEGTSTPSFGFPSKKRKFSGCSLHQFCFIRSYYYSSYSNNFLIQCYSMLFK